MQYLFTLQVSRYCLLAMQSSIEVAVSMWINLRRIRQSLFKPGNRFGRRDRSTVNWIGHRGFTYPGFQPPDSNQGCYSRLPITPWAGVHVLGQIRVSAVKASYDHSTRWSLRVEVLYPVNAKHVYNICAMLDQRRRRWADVVQML